MALYDLPVTYMPWPARESAGLDAARMQALMWSREMGLLDEGNDAGWDEPTYDRSDFALFAALTYPDAPGHRLDAITNFLVWLFFFDDVSFEGSAQNTPAAKQLFRDCRPLRHWTPVTPTPRRWNCERSCSTSGHGSRLRCRWNGAIARP